MLIGAGVILGGGIGAAIGVARPDLGTSTGLWIGGMIGLGLGMLASYMRSSS
tara:strand:- start:334 stop:489 length:156 start_codon:yes stop_codon:yes gene_type:complete